MIDFLTNVIIFCLVLLGWLLLLWAVLWVTTITIPDRRRARRRNAVALLEEDCSVPMATLIRRAEEQAEREWHEDWLRWRLDL